MEGALRGDSGALVLALAPSLPLLFSAAVGASKRSTLLVLDGDIGAACNVAPRTCAHLVERGLAHAAINVGICGRRTWRGQARLPAGYGFDCGRRFIGVTTLS